MLRDDCGRLTGGRERNIISSGSCCLAIIPEALRVHTLFGIALRHVITTTLSLALSIDSSILFAPDFVLEQDIRDVYGLPLSEIAEKQIEVRLTIDPSRRYYQKPTPCDCPAYPAPLLTFPSISTDIQNSFSSSDSRLHIGRVSCSPIIARSRINIDSFPCPHL